ncbi:MAG TPA: zinc-ribbon domain-containing protein [Chloroflexota bacterium]|nr:zinc-ribbon domain-containing protein [Chloroflexota bacterium]
MFCPACDTRYPATANFCMNCGIPLRESAAALRGDGRGGAVGDSDPTCAFDSVSIRLKRPQL